MKAIAPLRAAASLLLLAAGFAVLSPPPLSGQAGAGMTPADSAAVLLETARRFQEAEERAVAEALYRHILRRFPGTPAAMTARDLLPRVAGSAAGDGSVELQVWSTLYGLWLGVAVPGAFGADGPEPYGAGLLLGGPAGFLTGRAVARSEGLTMGQVRAITLGGTWGSWQGFGWQEVLGLGVGEDCPDGAGVCFEEDSSQEAFAAMVVGGLAGLATGAVLSRGPVSSAAATGANLGSLWGSWFGTALGVLVDLEDDDLLAAALLGGNAGLVAGALGTPRWGWSRNRWRLVSIAGVLGGLGGLGIDLLAQPDGDKALVGIPLATSLLGIGIGIGATRNLDDPTPGGDPGALLDGALLDLRDGSLSVGLPLPLPRRLPSEEPGGRGWRTGLGVTLFRAVF